jgi:hypothetical protein
VGEPLDLDAIASEHLTQCGAHDYGLQEYGCSCSDRDPRPVIARLVDEVKRLRGLLRDVDLYGQAFVYSPAGKEPLVLHPADVTVHMRADAVTAHEAALKVVHAAEAETDAARAAAALAHDPYGSDFQEAKARVELAAWQTNAAVDEWRASRA